MTTAITLKFVTSVALYIQLLILLYLYSSHRVRFFSYIVWAWSLFVASKATYIVQEFFPEGMALLPLFAAAGSAGDLFILGYHRLLIGDSREPAAFELLVRTHQDRVYDFCVRMLCDREEAFDLPVPGEVAAVRFNHRQSVLCEEKQERW